MRFDLDQVVRWVPEGSRILDLGCGDGELLSRLAREKNVSGYGLEIDPDHISRCVERGVNVIEHDLDEGLTQFANASFDIVIMAQTLQAMRRPDFVLDEMLRIGKECMVTLPNFGNWRCRLHLATRGQMPIADHLPHTWYSTPNIHLCTFRDFEALCAEHRVTICEQLVVGVNGRRRGLIDWLPNLLGASALYRLTRS